MTICSMPQCQTTAGCICRQWAYQRQAPVAPLTCKCPRCGGTGVVVALPMLVGSNGTGPEEALGWKD